MEPYLEKAERTGRLIVPSKLGCIPDEAYTMKLHEISLAGNMLKTLDPRLAKVRLVLPSGGGGLCVRRGSASRGHRCLITCS